MKESLLNVLELQQIDKEIDAQRKSQDEYPDEINHLKQELESARAQMEQKKQQTLELEKNRRLLEVDLEAANLDLKKHQERLYEVKTNREYDALQHEIEALRGRIEEHETAILETIENAEQLNAKLEADKTLYQEMEQESLKRIQELESRLNSVEENIKQWEDKRAGIESGIERRLLSTYNRIRRGVRGGVAVVAIEKGSCGGCFRQLAPQRLVEVRRQNSIIRCENCGRIFVWTEEVQV